MSLPISSKEKIIVSCREIAQEKGLSSINMRSVAAKCNVSVGAVYNYFPSKTELLCATIESIWKELFHISKEPLGFTDFSSCISWLFESIQQGSEKYPEFLFRHSITLASENKILGEKMMQNHFAHLKNYLREVLKRDTKIRANAFGQNLSEDLFVDYIFELFISSIANEKYDYNGILELARRYLY